jgi:hypothetical protein
MTRIDIDVDGMNTRAIVYGLQTVVGMSTSTRDNSFDGMSTSTRRHGDTMTSVDGMNTSTMAMAELRKLISIS